jgi:uncharacterized membrane protein YjdF
VIQTATPTKSAAGNRHRYALAWAMSVVALLVAMGGWLFNWYRTPWVDAVIHANSFFAATYLAGLYLQRRVINGHRRHRALFVFVVCCVGLAMGVVWEWCEWAYDYVSGPRDSIKGKFDTQFDLVMDALGALAAGLLLLSKLRRRCNATPSFSSQSSKTDEALSGAG